MPKAPMHDIYVDNSVCVYLSESDVAQAMMQ